MIAIAESVAPEEPTGWALSSIGEVARYINGRAFKPSEWQSQGYPIIRIQNLNNPKLGYNYSSESYEERYIIRHGDMLFAWSASLGAHIWKGGKAWLNQHIFHVIPKAGIEKGFLYYFLTKVTADLYTKAHGSGMVHVTKGKFESTDFLVPPTNEQKRIVAKIEELFSELDKGVESLKTACQQLKASREAVLKHAFEGKLTADWRAANPDKLANGEQLLAQIKAEREARFQQQLEDWKAAVQAWEAGGEEGKRPAKPRKLKSVEALRDEVMEKLPQVPPSWRWLKLGWMTCGVEYGTAAKSSSAGRIPVVRMGNMQDSTIDWTDLVYTSREEEINRYSLRAGDVLFNRTNSPELVGKTVIYRGARPAIFAGYLIRVNQIPSVVEAQYLNLFLNSCVAKQHGDTVKTDGVNQSNINGEKLQSYPFPYCSLVEQAEVVRRLDLVLGRIDLLHRDIDVALWQSDVLRQSILKKAFSGKLVPQDPDDEPASVLLERIRAEQAVTKPDRRVRKSRVEQPVLVPNDKIAGSSSPKDDASKT